ncbi:unnamed protein product [Pedinophyceae sp. YPF-701]|nr:unnamed protein product [Pedinophyceae sp. YPF-701]
MASTVRGGPARSPVCPRSGVVGAAPRTMPRRSSRLRTKAAKANVARGGQLSLDEDGNIELELVRNTRDLSVATPRCRPGALLRTACPAEASGADVELFSEHVGVTELLDLRSEEEQREDDAAAVLAGCITVDRLYDRDDRAPGGLAVQETTMDRSGDAQPEATFVRHRLSLLDRDRFYKALLWKLPKLTVARALVTQIWDGQGSKNIFLDAINAGGLPLLYEILIDTSKPEICKSLQVATECVEGGGTLLFYCKAGKDRTGLIAMLVLGLLGCSDAEIISDFAKSDKHRKVALGGMENKPELKRLDREVFSRAPPEAMEHILGYVKARYGSIEAYCSSIGFDATWQRRLRSALLMSEAGPDN